MTGVQTCALPICGVKKGAFDDAEAEKRFEAWKEAKEAKLDNKKSGLKEAERAEHKKRLEAEVAYNKAKAEELAKRQAEARAEAAAAEAAANAPVEEVKEEAAPAAE